MCSPTSVLYLLLLVSLKAVESFASAASGASQLRVSMKGLREKEQNRCGSKTVWFTPTSEQRFGDHDFTYCYDFSGIADTGIFQIEN